MTKEKQMLFPDSFKFDVRQLKAKKELSAVFRATHFIVFDAHKKNIPEVKKYG
jgi:hypothetical protein